MTFKNYWLDFSEYKRRSDFMDQKEREILGEDLYDLIHNRTVSPKLLCEINEINKTQEQKAHKAFGVLQRIIEKKLEEFTDRE